MWSSSDLPGARAGDCDVAWDLRHASWHMGPETPYASIELTLPAVTLALAYGRQGERLLAASPRGDLGDSRVNRALRRSLRDQPERFHLLHNGVTAICRGFRLVREGRMTTERLWTKGLQIIDGSQTTRRLWQAASSDATALAGSFVRVRVIAIPEPEGGELREAIATASQQHSRLRTDDAWPATAAAQRLQAAFASLRPPWYFELRRGDWRLLPAPERSRYRRVDRADGYRRVGRRQLARAVGAALGAAPEAPATPPVSADPRCLLLPLRIDELAAAWGREHARDRIAGQAPWCGWLRGVLVFAAYEVVRVWGEGRPAASRGAGRGARQAGLLDAQASAALLATFELWAPELVDACADGLEALIEELRREPAAGRRFFSGDRHLHEICGATWAALRREERLRAAHGLPTLATLASPALGSAA